MVMKPSGASTPSDGTFRRPILGAKRKPKPSINLPASFFSKTLRTIEQEGKGLELTVQTSLNSDLNTIYIQIPEKVLDELKSSFNVGDETLKGLGIRYGQKETMSYGDFITNLHPQISKQAMKETISDALVGLVFNKLHSP